VRATPPRVWTGPHRQVCPETAGQQPEIVALDSRSRDTVLRVRPPAVPLATWVRHLLSETRLGDIGLNARINAAYAAIQQQGNAGKDASLDHPRVTALYLEVIPLFPRARTSGPLLAAPLHRDARQDPYGDQKHGLQLTLRRDGALEFGPDKADVDIQLAGSQAVVTIAPGRTVEVRVYAAVDIDDFEGPKARFSAALARGRRRIGRQVLGAPLRLRAEASADRALVDTVIPPASWRERFTGRRTDVFADWGYPIADGAGQLQRVEARPTLAAPQSRAIARALRLFADVTVFDQRWSWRGRTGVEAPPADDAALDAFGGWSQRLFTGRDDNDAELEGPVALTPYHIRRRDSLADRPETPLVMRDLGYRGSPTLWRFALEFHGRYPSDPGFSRRTLDGPSTDLEDKRHARWAHVLARGALAAPGSVAAKPPEPRRPARELWLPLAEQLRDASAAAPVMLMFAEPWHALGNLGDRLQLVSILTRHPFPDAFSGAAGQPVWAKDELRTLFGDELAIGAALQYPKFWQSWGPDPILTGAASPFSGTTLALAGPLGWTQSEGGNSDFRRTSFLVEPQADPALTALLAARSMFQLAYRRIADPELANPPAGLLRGEALWQWAEAIGTVAAPRRRLAWRFHPPRGQQPNSPIVDQPAGYQGVRLDWSLPLIANGASLVLKIEDDAPANVMPRRLVICIDRMNGQIRVRAAMSEPLLDQQPPAWRINHMPPVTFSAPEDGMVELRLELSPTAPTEAASVEDAPDTFDAVLWTRPVSDTTAVGRQWQGGMLARFKAPEGKGTLRIDLPGAPDELGKTARLRPFAASAFSTPFWVQFFGDSSRFRCRPASTGAATTAVRKVEALKLTVSGSRATFATIGQVSGAASAIRPLAFDEPGTAQTPAPDHRLIAVVTRWITNAEGRLSEMPVFAAPLHTSDATGSSLSFPPNTWPPAGRVRLLTVLATKEARPFGIDDEPTASAPFRILDALLRPEAARANAGGPGTEATPFDLDSADSELREATMMVIGVSRPIELG